MGDYNPHAPYIIGQEWVPIDDYDLVYSPSVNSVEYGTTFTLDTPRQVSLARFYVKGPISQPMSRQCALVNIYPTGSVDSNGPVKQVTIPCTNASVTGSTTLSGSSVTDALYNPSDGGFVTFNYNGSNTQYLQMFFNTSAYPQLNGKRILNVSLLYTGSVRDVLADSGVGISITTEFVNPNKLWQSMTVVEQMDDADRLIQFLGQNIVSDTGTLTLSTSVANSSFSSVFSEEILPLNLGDVNNFWLPGVQPSGQKTDLPWTYDDLLKFEPTAATASRQRLRVQIIVPATAGTASFATFPQVTFRYMALRVTYCDETRVAYGGREFVYKIGANSIPIYNLSRQASPTLSAGTYLATLSLVSTGATDFGLNLNGQFPPLNAARELYPIPSHTPVKINVPFPIDEAIVDKQFTSEVTAILPQLSLHTSGAVSLLEPHVYGRQAKGQVYGSFTVTQEIDDTVALGAGEWPWVRFYARRYGNTTVPLTVTIAGSTASIDPEDFDEITELTHDFWREVTLELDPPLSMGTGIIPQAVWSATGEKAGNRWEVLGAAAPALTGSIPGSLVTKVPTLQQLGPATYGGAAVSSTIDDFSRVLIASAEDDFDRTEATGWGIAPTGGTWTSGGGVAGDYSVAGGTGRMSMSVVNSTRRMTLPLSLFELDTAATISVPVTATGAQISTGLMLAYADSSNYYQADLTWETNGDLGVRLVSRVAATGTNLDSAVAGTYSPGDTWHIRAAIAAGQLYARAWLDGDPEPDTWHVTAPATTITAAGAVGFRTNLDAGNTNTLPVLVEYDNLFVYPLAQSWGTSSSGLVWSQVGGVAANYAVLDEEGLHGLSTVDASRRTLLGVDTDDFDVTVTASCPVIALTSDIHVAIMARYQDGNNYYMLEPQFEPAGQLTLSLYKQEAGVFTALQILDPFPPMPTYVAGETIRFRFQGEGQWLRGKMWSITDAEPSDWAVEATDQVFTTGDIGLRSNLSAGNTNTLPVVIPYSDLVSEPVINMSWLPQLGPYVTAPVGDESADVSVIFSQSPPMVSGFGAEALSQVLTGIGQNCGIDPCCVPSELYYTRLSWTPWSGETDSLILLNDTFDNRTEVGAWGDPDYGPTWISRDLSGGSVSVSGGYGLHTFTVDDSSIIVGADVTMTDGSVYISNLAPGSTPDADFVTTLYLRDSGDFSYSVSITIAFLDDGTVDIEIIEVGGSGPITGGGLPGASDSEPLDLVAKVSGTTVALWAAPSDVGIDLNDPPLYTGVLSIATSGGVAIGTNATSGMTVPLTMFYGDVTIVEETTVSASAPNVYDIFDRDESNTWGTPNIGPAYDPSSSSELSVSDDLGLITLSNDPRINVIIPDTNSPNTDTTATFVNVAGGPLISGIIGRQFNDEEYISRIVLNTDQSVTAELVKLVSSSPIGLLLPGSLVADAAWASTPDTAVLDITGDIDLRCLAALDDWTPAANEALLSKFQAQAGSRSYLFRVTTSGALAFIWSTDGTNTNQFSATSTLPVPATNGQTMAVRVTLDVNDGGGNRVIRFYYSTDTDLSTAVWTQLGTTITTAGTTSIFAGDQPLGVGAWNGGSFEELTGAIYAAQVRDGIDGTIVAYPDFRMQDVGATSFVDSTGLTWTLHGLAEINREPVTISSVSISNNSYITTGVGSAVTMRFMVNGPLLKMKIWAPNTSEPTMWLMEEIDYDIAASTGYGIVAMPNLDNAATIGVSDLQISPPQYWFGSYEIQRMDTVEPEWKTIMKATNPALSEFNDFEARVGIVSTYRIRNLNTYDFYGPWSPEVSGMIPAPGVEIGCLGENGHVLIFSSNERQDGGINLAYSSVWLDEQVEENFTFPEAGFVQMQAMYDRDFYVAFRPLERGGEQFSRTLLVQAAAIAPETLADFTSLRDMAWATVNYICVRDEDGNRWLATVSVPSGNVLRNRRMYLAPVQIAEVTDTPTPVDASPWL